MFQEHAVCECFQQYRSWIRIIFNNASMSIWNCFLFLYLQGEVEPLLAVAFIVQAFLQPQGATLLLLVTDHVELLLLVSRHNTESELGIFSSISVLCSEVQYLRTNRKIMWIQIVSSIPLGMLASGKLAKCFFDGSRLAELQMVHDMCFCLLTTDIMSIFSYILKNSIARMALKRVIWCNSIGKWQEKGWGL